MAETLTLVESRRSQAARLRGLEKKLIKKGIGAFTPEEEFDLCYLRELRENREFEAQLVDKPTLEAYRLRRLTKFSANIERTGRPFVLIREGWKWNKDKLQLNYGNAFFSVPNITPGVGEEFVVSEEPGHRV